MTLEDIYHEHVCGSQWTDVIRVGREHRFLVMDGIPVGHILGPQKSERMLRGVGGKFIGEETAIQLRNTGKNGYVIVKKGKTGGARKSLKRKNKGKKR